MGGEQSTPEETLEYAAGYRVISVHQGSPCDDAQVSRTTDTYLDPFAAGVLWAGSD